MPAPTEQIGTTAPAAPHSAPPFARGPVLLLAGLVTALLLLISSRYGYLSDELYFIAAGKYPDWGYMDQQPLVPLLAAGLDAAFPGSLLALRTPAALVTALGIVLTALITRELGGDRRAQFLAACAYALSPWLLLSGHWLAAATLEPPQWLLLLWLVVRWTRVRSDALLLAAGAVAAVGVQTKFQIALLCFALVLGVLIAGPREMLKRRLLWTGVGVAAVASAPALAWQAANGWPALDMGRIVDAENARPLFLPTALLYSGVVVGAVLCCLGVWFLLRDEQLRQLRFLAWVSIALLAFYVIAGGRPNYLAGLYGMLFAAAAAGLGNRRARGGRWSWTAWPAYLLSALLPLALLPIYPLPVIARHPQLAAFSRMYETGWPELTETVARSYHALPPDVRERTAIVGESYTVTGAMDALGPRYGLPRVYSPHRGYWFFGAPPDSATVVLYVGSTRPLQRYFAHEQQLDTVRTRLDVVDIAQGIAVTRYDGPMMPWSRLWPLIRAG